ncbi:nuclease-related domain-containing protein [Nocardioides sp. R1-1]|uniref:nuclease-related domain-containing protein n=1 Tax=Nocardioides sp. R1-1 TaxID=3383502 RepID=UPI0038D06FB5
MAGESADDAARRMRAKAERLARSAERWERGAEGERATARVLDRLPADEWTVFHDVRWPGRRLANVDHVVIGPPGVFVIDSKNWSGTIEIREQALRHGGRRKGDVVDRAAEAALAVAAVTQVVGSDRVVAVLCFTRDEEIAGWAGDVMVCTTANLERMLLTRERVLDADVRRRLCLDIDASLRSATEPPAPRASRRPAAERSRRQARTRPRRRTSLARGLVGPLVGLTVVFAAIGTPLPRMLGDLFVSAMTSGGDSDAAEMAEATKIRDLLGTWRGSYRCGAQPTPATLVVRAGGNDTSVRAVLTFDVPAATSDQRRGRLRLAGVSDRGRVTLTPTAWVDRPPDYRKVGLNGGVEADGARFVGVVTTTGCTSFAFDRVS